VHPRRLLWFISALGAVALVAGACTSAGGGTAASAGAATSPGTVGGSPPFIPQIISSEAIVGQNRFLFGILDATGKKTIAAPSVAVQVGFTPAPAGSPEPGASPAGSLPPPIVPKPATFIWAIPDERGVYVIDATFPSAGDWVASFSASGGDVQPGTVGVQFQVSQTGLAIPLGGKAPATKTPTAATPADIAKIATDPSPDPSFYTTSVDEALSKHEPFVLVFATPAFCTSRQCGPTLDGIKAVAKDEPGMIFINVEPYKLQYADGHLQPVEDANNQLQPTDAAQAWGLLSEPWVFVVDGSGVVRGSFEAVVSAEELKAAIAAVR
jgi:hypothetical protein